MKIFEPVVRALGDYIRSEKNHPVGKANLVGGIIIALFGIIVLTPPLVMQLAKYFFSDKSALSSFHPIIAIIVLAIYFWASVWAIPRKPPL